MVRGVSVCKHHPLGLLSHFLHREVNGAISVSLPLPEGGTVTGIMLYIGI